jgi:3-hydroxyisobutyrate dehydrogenase-like beta-hydroxyacid dehydrogenase
MNAGHAVTGWNRSRDKATDLIAAGMRWADTPRAVAEKSEIVFSIVTDAAAVEWRSDRTASCPGCAAAACSST